MATIGWIGLGNMGRPMTANLVKAGHTVKGFDVVPEAVTAAAEAGVTPVGSIAEAVTDVDIVFTMLPKANTPAPSTSPPTGCSRAPIPRPSSSTPRRSTSTRLAPCTKRRRPPGSASSTDPSPAESPAPRPGP